MANILPPKPLSTLAVATELLPRDRIVGLRSPIDEPDKTKRNVLFPPSLLAGGAAVFPLTEPVFATGFGNLPAGYNPAGKSILEVLRVAGSQPYLFPAFSLFTIQDAGSQTVEVGTQFPAGFKSFKWSISNPNNLADAATITIVDETANSPLVTGTANDGVQSLSTVAFTVGKGLSRRYRISTQNDKGDTLSATIEIGGLFKSYFGYSSQSTLTLAQLLALGSGQLQNGHARTVGGVSAGPGLYTVYAWEDNAGTDDVAQILQDGVDSIRGAFRAVQRVTGPNALGATVTMAYVVSNATNAFTGSTLEFK